MSYSKADKDIHTPAILRKVETGRKARFTFSTYKLPCKSKRKYKLKCTVARCGRVFNSVKNSSLHHLQKHQSAKYR